MNEPLFGKQGNKKPTDSSKESGETSQPSIKLSDDKPSEPMITSETASSFPAADALIKPFEGSIDSAATALSSTIPAPTPLPQKEAPFSTNDETNLREKSSATFRRLDDVETTENKMASPNVEQPVTSPSPIDEAASITQSLLPTDNSAELSIAPSTSEPMISADTPSISAAIDNTEPLQANIANEPIPYKELFSEKPSNQPLANDGLAASSPISSTIEIAAETTGDTLEAASFSVEPSNTIETEAPIPFPIDTMANEEPITAEIEEPARTNEALAATVATEENINLESNVQSSEPLTEVVGAATTVLDDDVAIKLLIQEHQLWLDSAGAEGRRAVFRENLKGVDFSHKRLSGASFHGLNLDGCNFTQTFLNEVDFGECQLNGANFTAANLDSAIMTNITANDVIFSAAQMEKTEMGGSQCERADFTQATMKHANMRDSNLTEAKLQNVTAHSTNFRGANLSQADLNNGDFTQAIFREASLNGAIIESANLVQTIFKDAHLNRVDLNSADFSQAIDVSSEVQSEFMQIERTKLQQELQSLAMIRSELEERERRMISERQKLQRTLQQESTKQVDLQRPTIEDAEITEKLKKSGRLFLGFGIGWAILSFCVAIIMQNVISQMDSADLSVIEMILMGILLVMPLIFFVISMAKSFSLSNALRKITQHDSV